MPENLSKQENPLSEKDFLVSIGSNRCLAAGRLEIDFKKPFDLLAKLPAEAKGDLSAVARRAKEGAPSDLPAGRHGATNSIWWT